MIAPRLIVAALAGLALFAAGLLIYNGIYDRGYEAATAFYVAKELRTKAANDAAITLAERKLKEDIAKLKEEKEALEYENARLDADAAQDPHAGDGALGADSVQRLNSVR